MNVSSPCEICNRADVEYACDRCGRLVCDRHFDDDYGFCLECAAAVEEEGQGHVPPTDDMPDGVDTYRF